MDTAKKRLYVETTIPSYATAWTSADSLTADMQATTKRFWQEERDKFELFVSDYVSDECSLGDENAAQRRLDFIGGIEVLPKNDEIDTLAALYKKLLGIPEKADTDCYHLATCVMSGMDYLLSWNCTHLGANSFLKVKEYNEAHHLWTPQLVTPEFFVTEKE
jgi:hypothetical protein